MKIRFTERSLIRRFGNKPIEVSDSQAVMYMEEDKAAAITSFDSPPISKEIEDAPSSKKAERRVVGMELGILLSVGSMIQRNMVEQNLATSQ